MASGGTNVGRLFATLDLDTASFTSGLARAGTMFATFGRGISTGASYAAAGAAALQGIGGAVAVIGQIAPAAALAIPAVIGLGTALGTIKLAFGGVLSAVKAYGQSTGSSVNTSRQAEQAAHGLTTAQWGLTSATNSYNTAVKAARQNLADLQKLVDRAPTDMEQASLDLREARENLAKVQSNGLSSNDQIEEARLAVTRASYAFDDQTESVQKNQQALAAAQAQGIDGNQGVIDAVHQLTQAQWALADAQRQTLNPSGPNAYAQAMAKLPPMAQTFVRTLIGMKPLMDGLKVSASNIFPGVTSAVTKLKADFPVLNEGIRATALQLGSAADYAGGLFSSVRAQGAIGTIMQNNAVTTGNLARALANVGSGFLNIGAVAAPILKGLSFGADSLSEKFKNWTEKAADSGQLKNMMTGALQALGQLWIVVEKIGGGIGNLFRAVSSNGGGFLNTLSAVADAFLKLTQNTALQSILGSLAHAFSGILGQALNQLLSIIAGILPSIQSMMPAIQQLLPIFMLFATGPLGPLMKILGIVALFGPAIQALAGPLVQLAGIFASVFADLMTALQPLVTTIGQTLGKLLSALMPLFDVMAANIVQFVGPLATMVGLLIKGLEPIIEKLIPPITLVVDAIGGALTQVLFTLMDALEPLIPVIGNVLVTVVSALADVIVQSLPALEALIQAVVSLLPPLLPLVPAVMGLVVAALPLIPALLQIAVAIIQMLMPVIIPLISIIVELLDWLVMLATKGLTVVVGWVTDIAGWLSKLAGHFGDLPGMIGKALGGLENLITAPFRAAFNAIGDLWNRSVGSIHFNVPNWVPGLGGKGFTFPTLPHLAQGGVVGAGGGLAVVGDGGEPEIVDLPGGASVTPLSRLGSGGGGFSLTVIHNGPIYDRSGLDELARQLVVPLRIEINRFAGNNGGSAGYAA